MKRKVGLQRKISAIFDGVPIPKSGNRAVSGDVVQQQPANAPPPSQNPPESRANQWQMASQPDSEPTAPSTPAAQTLRPARPAPSVPQPAKRLQKHKFYSPQVLNLWRQIKVKLYGSPDGSIDPRQVKMTIVAVTLSIVLIYVFVSVFKQPAGEITSIPADTAAGEVFVPADLEINWVRPEVYPLTLADPMQPRSFGSHSSGELIVTGIVFSDQSMAIIAGEMISQGEEIFGVTVVKINKDSVEFENKDGERFTRKVGRR